MTWYIKQLDKKQLMHEARHHLILIVADRQTYTAENCAQDISRQLNQHVDAEIIRKIAKKFRAPFNKYVV